jgi:hypothetical protein
MVKRVCLVGVCLVGVLLALSGQASAQGHWAVVCGIADYPGTANDLNYTDDDANDMVYALSQHTEWQGAGQIQRLINGDANRGRIQLEIQSVLGKAAAGDVFLFFFSGHGTQVRDTSGEERDGYDEAICQYDFGTAGPIKDDDLATWLAPLADNGVRVVVILDTCFSGGMAKGVQVKCLRMPGVRADVKAKRSFGFHVAQRLAQRKPPGGKPPGGGGGGLPSQDIGGANSVVLMACQEGGLSYETSALENGVFSYFVIQGLGTPTSAPADSDRDGTVSAEEAFAYAAPRTSSYVRVQKPRLYDGNPYAEVELFDPPPPPASVNVAVTTDKTAYTNGQRARITVTVTEGAAGPAIEGALVTAVVTDAKGRKTTYQGTTDSAGMVTFSYKVSTSTGGTGTYKVDATATKLGVSGTASTTFTVN